MPTKRLFRRTARLACPIRPAFLDPMAANDTAISYRHREGTLLEPYQCQLCKWWHLRKPDEAARMVAA